VTHMRHIMIGAVVAALGLVTANTAGWAESQDTIKAAVCVYGGTSGGVIAAVEAARLGKKVVLVEPGRHLGGMSSGGLGWTDNGATDTIGGLAREFYERIYGYYQSAEAWKYQTRPEYVEWLRDITRPDGRRIEELKAQFIFEPHVAEQV